ncbi:protein ORF114 [Anguillid herpesvirus 1]|uniref:Protein ORF114 n=1 Tax=Anguillid herpesvirus 1 TaxID=150286 RepID=A0A1J0REL9_9VIRU|nr:protein ORF114 [Anguillid herpesvirus 1]ADA57877.1 protein ORF114 [Anguillid herpesvirus 1]APD76278.1 ORF114 [Anguillid herpesvirus 1]QRM16408.1 protein ORF114 [Anguillid herpesvirus 1]QRM16535.1 protein ORF114 [Anguillid herpesvirus 1]QRM16667.1 protein ORF114 [Anguillid herpesvirus 1]
MAKRSGRSTPPEFPQSLEEARAKLQGDLKAAWKLDQTYRPEDPLPPGVLNPGCVARESCNYGGCNCIPPQYVFEHQFTALEDWLKTRNCYFKITHARANRSLEDEAFGTWLIRPSSGPVAYPFTLSYKDLDEVRHIRIGYDDVAQGWIFVGEKMPAMKTVAECVAFMAGQGRLLSVFWPM